MQSDEESGDEGDEKDEDKIGGLFKVVSQKEAEKSATATMVDKEDCALFTVDQLQDWDVEDVRTRIQDCFVTGKWGQGEDAAELLKLDEEDEKASDNEELFGDFEDLETGKKVSAAEEKAAESEEEAPRVVDLGGDIEREKAKRKARYDRKIALKRQFDVEYDDGETANTSTFYDELRREVDEQANLNKTEFEAMEDSQRVLYEGFRPGMYVRLEIEDMPCELIENFDATVPLIVGGINKGEGQIGNLQARIKKHRWFPRTLKNRDPIIVSLGWRRFQTLPIFSICDHNMRRRMLKYTPAHLHCDATFWGPATPQGSGIVAVQSLDEAQENFRIVATGVLLEMDQSQSQSQVMKKLKLTGEPYKIFKNTAFIKGMFNSSLEVAKFEKAQIKTVSGIRGIIKKALHEPEGAFRASFEDKILLSDIVFVKTWYKIEIPKYYAPVTNILDKNIDGEKYVWKGMRTTAQIKRDANIRHAANEDSLYRPVHRETKVFQPMKVPKKLQQALPYHLKPKLAEIKVDPTKDRVAVVLDHKERKINNAFKMLRTLHGDKMDKLEQDKIKRRREFLEKKRSEELRKMKKQKEAKQQISRMMSRKKAMAEAHLGRGKPKRSKRK